MLKRILFIASSTAFLIGGCSTNEIVSSGKEVISEQNNPSVIADRVPGFENLKDLEKASNTIVTASISSTFNEVETPLTGEPSVYQLDYVYNVTIEKNVKDSLRKKLKKGDTIVLVVPIGVRQRLNGQKGDLSQFQEETITFEEGTYMLFLNGRSSNNYGKLIYTIANTYHIYKLDTFKGIFKNVVSDKIPVIEKAGISRY